MSTVGQREKKTQQRVVKLFREQLGYDYLGDRTDREGNRNIEDELLRSFLREKQRPDSIRKNKETVAEVIDAIVETDPSNPGRMNLSAPGL